MSWQPIETAPKDGTIFLFYASGTGWINTGFWQGRSFMFHHLGESGGKEPKDPNPTHWMPLPEPPKS